MAEYTYKDIIVDPTSEEAKNAVGKEVYFADTPASCLNAAKNNNKAYLGYLEKLDLGDEEQPFYVNEFVVSAPSSWVCIIVKKEEPKPKYVPFESEHEFILAYFNKFITAYCKADKKVTESTESILSRFGIWLRLNDEYVVVTCISDEFIVISENLYYWNELLEHCTFLDGTPCGKESKDE